MSLLKRCAKCFVFFVCFAAIGRCALTRSGKELDSVMPQKKGIKASSAQRGTRLSVTRLAMWEHSYQHSILINQDGDGHKLINLCAMSRILCVAEKPAIAKAVAQHLSGGSMQTVSLTGAEKKKKFLCEVEFAKNDVGVDTGKSICQELSI